MTTSSVPTRNTPLTQSQPDAAPDYPAAEEKFAAVAEELLHRVRVAERQVSLEQEPIETRECPRGRRGVFREELAQGALRLVAVTSDEHGPSHHVLPGPVRPAASRRRGGFGCGREAALDGTMRIFALRPYHPSARSIYQPAVLP